MRETTVDNKKDNRFEILKELLLTDDRQKFESLRDQFLEKDKIRENINPVVDEKIDDLKANFPEHFGDQITQSIKVQIRESQDEVVEVNSYNKKEATISFSVKDTGRGMTEEQALKMFEEYQQNRLSDNRLHKGVGLGLSIVKRLVQEMGGKITVDSFVNYETTVIIEIPFVIHKENDEDDIENSENSGYKSIEGKKVLVADDNFLNLTIVSHILTKEKTDFTLVKDGVEALNALEKTKFDIVLLDINMPNLTGEELIKRKKELNQDNSKTPFLALTGNNSKDDIEGYKNIGFEDVIPKPFTAVQFVETIKKYL